jgi:hypothetical protein
MKAARSKRDGRHLAARRNSQSGLTAVLPAVAAIAPAVAAIAAAVSVIASALTGHSVPISSDEPPACVVIKADSP